MSAYSTLKITRDKAKSIISNNLISCSDEELEGMLDSIIERYQYNYIIVPDNDNKERTKRNK